MVESLIRQIRGVRGALMKVIKPTKDKSTRSRKLFRNQFHTKQTTEQLKNRSSISSTCSLHR